MAGLTSKGTCIGGLSWVAAIHLAPVQNLKIYVEAFLGFSHRFSPDGLNDNLLSQGHVLENVGTVGRMYIPRTGKRGDNLQCLGPAHGSNGNRTLLMTSYNTVVIILY